MAYRLCNVCGIYIKYGTSYFRKFEAKKALCEDKILLFRPDGSNVCNILGNVHYIKLRNSEMMNIKDSIIYLI